MGQADSGGNSSGKTELSIARIGLISALVVAACGLLGTLATVLGTALSSYYASQAARDPVLIPLQATQTAEARQASATGPSVATEGAPMGTVGAPTLPPQVAPEAFLVQNRLVLPVRFFIDGAYQAEIGALSDLSVPLASGSVNLRWEVVKETTSSGRALGDEMGGDISNIAPGDIVLIDNLVGEQAYFYPRVSNNTAQECEVIVNYGWENENITGALLPAHSPPIGLGYYKLFTNSNLTLDCPQAIHWWGLRPEEVDEGFFEDVEPGSGLIEFTLQP